MTCDSAHVIVPPGLIAVRAVAAMPLTLLLVCLVGAFTALEPLSLLPLPLLELPHAASIVALATAAIVARTVRLTRDTGSPPGVNMGCSYLCRRWPVLASAAMSLL